MIILLFFFSLLVSELWTMHLVPSNLTNHYFICHYASKKEKYSKDILVISVMLAMYGFAMQTFHCLLKTACIQVETFETFPVFSSFDYACNRTKILYNFLFAAIFFLDPVNHSSLCKKIKTCVNPTRDIYFANMPFLLCYSNFMPVNRHNTFSFIKIASLAILKNL